MRIAIGLLPFLSLGIMACATAPDVRMGMTKDQVEELLGKPLRVERTEMGSEIWFYPAVRNRRVAAPYQNAQLPGESVHDRDLRFDTEGYESGVEYSTSVERGERVLRFAPGGALAGQLDFRPGPVECSEGGPETGDR